MYYNFKSHVSPYVVKKIIAAPAKLVYRVCVTFSSESPNNINVYQVKYVIGYWKSTLGRYQTDCTLQAVKVMFIHKNCESNLLMGMSFRY